MFALGCLVLATPSLARAATIEIDCAPTAADDFCGALDDPCVVDDNLVITAASCAPNFGTRVFRNEGKISLPNGGSLTLSAGAIEVNGKIDGKHTGSAPAGDGADVSLTAAGLGAASDVTVNRKVNVSGSMTAGSIAIDAEGDVQLEDQLIARRQGASAPMGTGGTITVHADGTVSSSRRAKINVRGKKEVTPAGVADISGDLGVHLRGRIEARGLFGGSVSATAAAGDLTIEEEIRLYGEFGGGGSVVLSAPGGALAIPGPKGTVKAKGGDPGGGGSVMLFGASITVARPIDVRGTGTGIAPGGTIAATGGVVDLAMLRAEGTSGGSIAVTSTIGAVNIGRISADGRSSDGGTVLVSAADGMTVEGPVEVQGDSQAGNGGEARFTSAGSGDLVLGSVHLPGFDATGTTGGVIEAETTGTGGIEVTGDFDATTGGCIALIDGVDNTPTIGANSTFDPAFQTTSCP